jgi:Type I phosphodiesterase / nucleotide pyrophosphatase
MSGLNLFVLIDALGWELIRERPFLNEFLPHRQPLRSLLGFSSGIIPSILTGLTPAESGMWNLVYYDPVNSPFRWMKSLGPLPSLFDNRIGRRLLTEAGRRMLGMGGNFDVSVPPETLPWFHWSESRNIYARGGIPGHRSIFDELHERGIAHRIYSHNDRLTDTQILAQAERNIADGEGEFYFLYLSELDMFLHTHRKQPELIEAKLAWYEESLGRVFRVAKQRDSHAGMRIFSDHGMAPVDHHCDVASVVAGCGFQSPRDYLAVYDSTMARFWFFSEQARSEIRARLGQLEYARLLPEVELRKLGVYFEDHRYGEEVLLLQPGCIIAEGGFNGRGWKPTGMHGYHPDDVYSDAVFLSSEPRRTPLATVRDVFGNMQEAIG